VAGASAGRMPWLSESLEGEEKKGKGGTYCTSFLVTQRKKRGKNIQICVMPLWAHSRKSNVWGKNEQMFGYLSLCGDEKKGKEGGGGNRGKDS